MKIVGFSFPSFEGAPIDATLATLGHKATVAGATGSGISWILSSQTGVAIGIIAALAGLVTNFYFSRKRDAREAEEHALRMEELRNELAKEVLAAADLAAAKLLADARLAGATIIADAKLAQDKKGEGND